MPSSLVHSDQWQKVPGTELGPTRPAPGTTEELSTGVEEEELATKGGTGQQKPKYHRCRKPLLYTCSVPWVVAPGPALEMLALVIIAFRVVLLLSWRLAPGFC